MDDLGSRLPGVRAYAEDIATHALVVGDPNRAAAAAQHLDGAQEVGNWREYRTFTGHYKGKRITISSHGVGAAGAAVCFESLFYGGVRTVIRAGTCGAMQLGIDDGDFVIATGAVREDGTTPLLIPLTYPAVANYRVVQALESAATEAGFAEPHLGLVRTGAAFFPGLLPPQHDMWMKANVIATEMELAALLVIASLRGARAGGILVSDGNLAQSMEETKKGKVYDQFQDYNPHRDVVRNGVETMVRVALDALAHLD